MASSSTKKRSFSGGPRGRAARPTKKQRQMAAYHSSSEDEGAPVPANLLDSDDEDLDNVQVDDGASSAASDSQSETEPTSKRQPPTKSRSKPQPKQFIAKDAPDHEDTSSSDSGSEGDDDMSSPAGSHASSTRRPDPDPDPDSRTHHHPKSKRNDPAAFATSISKMLAAKLSRSRRADPIVSRSAAAAAQVRQAADATLEAKARRRLREQRRAAQEKGRVRDVLVAAAADTTQTVKNPATGEDEVQEEERVETTGEMLAVERRLRKVAQRGVVKLFNAVRVAQVKAAEAERAARREGIVGVKRKDEKVAEMSRKGFLDLIAGGGGGLKKGALEEA